MPSDIPGLEFRPASADDQDLLALAVLTNVNAVVERATAEDVARDPEHRAYYERFPAASDFGIVAESEEGPVGVVWCRFSSEAAPLNGYVADDIPELTICVFEGQRGLGLGHALIDEIEKEALRRGVRALSLYVEEGNRSVTLYRRRGFVPTEAPGVLVKLY